MSHESITRDAFEQEILEAVRALSDWPAAGDAELC